MITFDDLHGEIEPFLEYPLVIWGSIFYLMTQSIRPSWSFYDGPCGFKSWGNWQLDSVELTYSLRWTVLLIFSGPINGKVFDTE